MTTAESQIVDRQPLWTLDWGDVRVGEIAIANRILNLPTSQGNSPLGQEDRKVR